MKLSVKGKLCSLMFRRVYYVWYYLAGDCNGDNPRYQAIVTLSMNEAIRKFNAQLGGGSRHAIVGINAPGYFKPIIH